MNAIADSVIYKPLEEFNGKYRSRHEELTQQFFDKLVSESGVNIEENRATVLQYNTYKDNLVKLKRKLNWMRFFRVLMIIVIVLIPLVILKMTPKIRALREEIKEAGQKIEELLALAYQQMLPLSSLFTDRDALNLISETVPMLSFDPCFTIRKESDMRTNYDFEGLEDAEQSTVATLSGAYNENPFLFENKIVHTMGTETYYGTKTITWTETYRDSDGHLRSRTRTETLRAQLVKPKPYYNTQVVLNYGSQGAPDLCFSRDATHLEQKSKKAINRMVKSGEKKLKKRTDKAIKENKDFVSMANTDFEVLFDALNRNDEVQFRALFTPLAQTNMVDLILSKDGYGDDFNFFKVKRMNKILSNHSQGRPINLTADMYTSYSFDIIKENFIGKNTEFFKAVYFDFAPLFAIPAYQERPVHSLKPIPDMTQLYSMKESEVLANSVDREYLVHPQTKTQAILKTQYLRSSDKTDETKVTAYSYDIEKRLEYVSVRGGDGHLHNVPVEWDEYLPLQAENNFCITEYDAKNADGVLASRNGLCIMKV